MIKQIKTLLQQRKETRECAQEAMLDLGGYVQREFPHLIEEYNGWFTQRRNINAAVLTKAINEVVFDLEGKIFDEHKKQISFFAAASARIADDVLDEGLAKPEETYFLSTNPIKRNSASALLLLDALENRLRILLPKDFCQRFNETIRRYNQAQIESLELANPALSKGRLVDLKDRTGGYSALLLYSFMFPELDDSASIIAGCYNPLGNLPQTKMDAIYNWGSWLSRIDDLWDVKGDRQRGLKNLASDGLVNWRSFKQDERYVFGGLKLYYPTEKVDKVQERFQLMTNWILMKLF